MKWKEYILYPFIVALLLGIGGTAVGVWSNQITIMANQEHIREDIDRLYSLVDDHIKEGH